MALKTVRVPEAFAPLFFGNLVVVLDGYFVHRTRAIEGKDGNPLNEVRMLCSSILGHDGVLAADGTIKYKPEASVLGLAVGKATKRPVDLGGNERVKPAHNGFGVGRVVLRELERAHPTMQACTVGMRAVLNPHVIWRQRAFEWPPIVYGLVHRQIQRLEEFLEPWRRWRRRLERRYLHQRFQCGIERGLHLRHVGKKTAPGRERTCVAPAIAVIEDPDDETVANLHGALPSKACTGSRSPWFIGATQPLPPLRGTLFPRRNTEGERRSQV